MPVGGICHGIVVVCSLLRCKLVRGVLPDCDQTFGGGQGHGQEGLSLEPAQWVKVRARKGAENLNFFSFRLKEGGCYGHCFGLVWLPGGVPCNLVMTCGL